MGENTIILQTITKRLLDLNTENMKTLKFDWDVEYSWGIGKSATKRIVHRKTEFYFIDKFEEVETRNNPYIVDINNNIFSEEELL
jgi:hypothetical protein